MRFCYKPKKACLINYNDEVKIMKLKKLTAVLAAAAMMCVCGFSSVYAEDSESSSEEVEMVQSDDGLWGYEVHVDEESQESYALLAEYYGDDAELVIPSEVGGYPVRELGEYVFYENTFLTKVTIPETLEDFGNFSFFGCESIEEYVVDEGNEIYKSVDGAIIGDNNDALFVCYPPAKPDTEYTVPDGIIAINPGAFAVCKNLQTINFPDTLTEFGYYCFAECTSLNNIVIPDQVSELAEFTFTGCTALTDITLPDTLHTIGAGAFSFCSSLDSINFPKYIMEIGQGAFTATGFTEIEIPSTVQNIGYYAFGYEADEQGQFIPMESFTIKGVEGSVAQSYCSENTHITFESIEVSAEEAVSGTENTSETEKDKDNDSGLKSGQIAAICIVGVIVIASVIAAVVKVKKGKNTEVDEDNEKASENDNQSSEEK